MKRHAAPGADGLLLLAVGFASIALCCQRMTALVDDLRIEEEPVSLEFRVEVARYWCTGRYCYVDILGRQGGFGGFTRRLRTSDTILSQVVIRVPGDGIESKLTIPGLAEGFLFIRSGHDVPGVWRLRRGQIELGTPQEGISIAGSFQLHRDFPTASLSSVNTDESQSLRLPWTDLRLDRGAVASMIDPDNVRMALHLREWYSDDSALAKIVVMPPEREEDQKSE